MIHIPVAPEISPGPATESGTLPDMKQDGLTQQI